MKYFLDTEFIENGVTIDPISIGIVSEDGREFYREFLECDFTKADKWVRENVLPNLTRHYMRKEDIANEFLEFIGDDDDIEFWGYYADYDWIVVCQMFGRMIDLPKPLPMFCMDLKQLMKMKGLNIKQENSNHNALEDAKWIKETWERIHD